MLPASHTGGARGIRISFGRKRHASERPSDFRSHCAPQRSGRTGHGKRPVDARRVDFLWPQKSTRVPIPTCEPPAVGGAKSARPESAMDPRRRVPSASRGREPFLSPATDVPSFHTSHRVTAPWSRAIAPACHPFSSIPVRQGRRGTGTALRMRIPAAPLAVRRRALSASCIGTSRLRSFRPATPGAPPTPGGCKRRCSRSAVASFGNGTGSSVAPYEIGALVRTARSGVLQRAHDPVQRHVADPHAQRVLVDRHAGQQNVAGQPPASPPLETQHRGLVAVLLESQLQILIAPRDLDERGRHAGRVAVDVHLRPGRVGCDRHALRRAVDDGGARGRERAGRQQHEGRADTRVARNGQPVRRRARIHVEDLLTSGSGVVTTGAQARAGKPPDFGTVAPRLSRYRCSGAAPPTRAASISSAAATGARAGASTAGASPTSTCAGNCQAAPVASSTPRVSATAISPYGPLQSHGAARTALPASHADGVRGIRISSVRKPSFSSRSTAARRSPPRSPG